MNRPLHRARMAVSRDSLDALMEHLSVLDPPPTSWEDLETGQAWVECFDEDRSALMEQARQMADLASELDGLIHAAEISLLEAADWTEQWKQYFHTTRVSERILVHPSWEPLECAADDLVVTIDPGMSFGTGLHPTTRTCLTLLDDLAKTWGNLATARFVDLGCGSGILSIAAARLGFGPITALDHDPLAVRISRENIALNRLDGDRIACRTADVLADRLPEGDLVVANILASVLVVAAPRIAGSVCRTPAGFLILSGILESQFAEVEQAYRKEGFCLVESREDSGWRTGRFQPATRRASA